MTALVAAFALSFVASIWLEARPLGLAALGAPWRATAIRLLLHLAVFAAAFSLSWRPWHAALVSCVIALLFGAGSAMKRRILGEPVVFSDFALVRNAVRHPRLYYAEKLAEPKALGLFAAIALATAGWFAVEPALTPPWGWPSLTLPPLVAALAVLALRSRGATEAARDLVGERPDADRDIERFGVLGSMTLHWLVWRRQQRPSVEAKALVAARPPAAAGGPRIVVAIQCESFLDLAARGVAGPDLSNWRALCGEALAWGRCGVPGEGAYTMRAEFGFLTGLPTATLGFDCFDPYLVAEAYAEASIARRFRAAGRATAFIHPYDRRFFDRETLIPKLGFDRFVDGEAFAGAARFGPYVGDAAVADALVAEIDAAEAPTFLFAVTIENHGPWGPGRLAETDDPAEQYALHLQNTDCMLGRVAEALRRAPGGGLLCAFGDHAPARTLHPGLPARRFADYLLWDPLSPAAAPSGRRDLDVDAVGRLLFERANGA